MAEYGFIYVLSNSSMPGMFKIGYTTKHPLARCAELSSKTSCPTPFYVELCFDTEDPQRVEAEIHRKLAAYRVNDAREFFKVPPDTLLAVMEEFFEYECGLVSSKPLEFRAYLERLPAPTNHAQNNTQATR